MVTDRKNFSIFFSLNLSFHEARRQALQCFYRDQWQLTNAKGARSTREKTK